MDEQTIKTLAANPPRRALKFHNCGKALKHIRQLEGQLGLPASNPTVNIFKANARVRELEAMLAAKSPVAKPAAASPAQIAPPALSVAASDTLDRAKQVAIGKVLGLNFAASTSAGAVMENLERAAYIAGVRFPGMTADAELATIHRRICEPRAKTGISRVIQAELQQKISTILES